MRRLPVGLLLLLLVLSTPAAAAGVFPYKLRTETLANGLRVVLVPMMGQTLVTYITVVRTGSRDEVEAGKSGFAHFFEHMMFRGTKRYPAEEYERIVASTGASRNASTGSDTTTYYATVAREDLPTIIDVESDRFQNLSYGEEAFRTEAGAVYGEYRKSITDPFDVLEEKLFDTAFDTHTYKHTAIGFEPDIKAMPEGYEYSKSFFERFYRPDNCVIIVAGDFDPEATLALIRKSYDGWKKGYQAPAIPREPPQTRERSAEVAYAGKTLPILELAYKGDAFDARNRRYVAALLFAELAFGETSDLYRELYVRQRKVEALRAEVPMNRDPTLYRITATVKQEADLPAVRAAIEATLDRYQKRPVDAARLRDLKRRWRYSLLMRLDSPPGVAFALARYASLTGGVDVLEELFAAVAAVTAKDVMDAARTYYRPERRTAVVLKGKAS